MASATPHMVVAAPTFNPQNPELWAIMLECYFQNTGAQKWSDKQRYSAVVATLPAEVIAGVQDLLYKPPATQLHPSLVARLLKEYQPPTTIRIRNIINFPAMGDQKPSQFLTQMSCLLPIGEDKDGAFFRELYLMKLPPHIQDQLKWMGPEANIDTLAQTADKFLKPSGPPTPPTVLGATVAPNQAASTTHHKSKFIKPPKKDSPWCWYHDHYGKEAKKCTPPCTWAPASVNEQAGRQ